MSNFPAFYEHNRDRPTHKLAKRVRVNIGFPVLRTDGRSMYGLVITNFSGMGRFIALFVKKVKDYGEN